MAITKHDMFDFLIDIVPREEIQFKTKSQKVRVGWVKYSLGKVVTSLFFIFLFFYFF